MVDALLYAVERARVTGARNRVGVDHGRPAVVVTLHRPANVDNLTRLESIMRALREVAGDRPVLFPVHPRTRARLDAAGLDVGAVKLMAPVGYLEMLDLMDAAHAVITDSGGLQVESAALGVPCLTVRDTTEWPETITCGANQLIYDPVGLPAAVASVHRLSQPPRPEGWDGMAAVRVVDCLRTR
jgi:UDP-N-acetylglucosamine 2-epimerase (non-hydrolysing)